MYRIGKFVILLLLASQVKAATITGRILDANTKETLVGANVYIKTNTQYNDISGLDGSFSIKNVPTGQYTLVVSYISYIGQEKAITVNSPNEVIKLEFQLKQNVVELNQVVVTSKYDRETSNYARNTEKVSSNVLNAISANSIQLLPDITVANVLQRVSGVSVQKSASSGDGQYAIITGMDKRYNYTLVNGIKIPSPDNKNRYVPMDIFPSEILQRLEVIKALTPEMEGDAIGGAMNLVLKDAPDKLSVKASVAGGYSQMLLDRPYYRFDTKVISKKSPAQLHGNDYHASASDFPVKNINYKPVHPAPDLVTGLTIGDRFFKNKKLGILLSSSYHNTYGGANTFFFKPSAQPDVNNVPVFDEIQIRTYSTRQKRLGLHAKLTYDFNKRNKISLYNVYLQLDKIMARHTVDSVLSIQRTGPGSGLVELWNMSKLTNERIYNSTLQGTHIIGNNFLFDWSAVYSRAWANIPDWTELKTTHQTGFDINNQPFATPQTILDLPRQWLSNNDRDLAGYANLSYSTHLSNTDAEIKIGGMYRHKVRDNYNILYTLYARLVNGQPQVFSNIYNAKFEFRGGNNTGQKISSNNYTSEENISAYYGEVKLNFNQKFYILTGARVEHTYQHYVTELPADKEARIGTQVYTDILPSIHLKYIINPKQHLRFSYFSSISRPSYFEITPYEIPGEYYKQEGNPYLKRSRARNYDFRYELFPNPSDQLLLGLFYKTIFDPIEYTFIRSGPSDVIEQPDNFGTAKNYGFEAVLIKYIKKFGISASYTYTKSRITTSKAIYEPDYTTNTNAKETRPMQGQADNIANVSLIYKNPLIGFDLQLAAVYTGKHISQISPYYGLDYWSMPVTTLDLSFEKRLSKKVNLSIYGKANNLLNTSVTTRLMQHNSFRNGIKALPEQDSNNSILVQKENYRQNYLLGLRYTF